MLIEGINTTEGTGGAGFYFDYSLEEVFLGTSGQSAEMPNPGVQSQFIAKSGGNQFNVVTTRLGINNSLQGANIPDEYQAPSAFNNTDSRPQHRDRSLLGHGHQHRRPDQARQSVVVRHLSQAVQRDRSAQLPVRQDVRHDAVERDRQGHLPGDAEPQVHWLLPVGPEDSAQSPPGCTGCASNNYVNEGPTNRQDSGSWVYKAEWNGTLSEKLYVEARYGDFGYYFPQITNGTDQYFFRDNGRLEIFGSHMKNQNDRDQAVTGAATYFLDTAKGNHTLKIGGEVLRELQWFGVLQGVGGNIEHVYNNGVSNQLIFRIPTATQVGGLKDNDNGHLTAENALDQESVF